MSDTHEIVLLTPKPSPAEILSMCAAYFNDHPLAYDEFDLQTQKRRLYCDSIDRLIAEDLRQSGSIANLLSIACGTGRRDRQVRQQSGRDYSISGCDISPQMCKLASARGIQMYCGAWPDDIFITDIFDACTFTYSFGHLPSSSYRLRALEKAAAAIRTKAHIYIDAMNIDDTYEWGPRITSLFSQASLANHGYELGDVFYRARGDSAISYFHYFKQSEIVELLARSGFEIVRILYIGYANQTGQIVSDPTAGSIFIVAKKV